MCGWVYVRVCRQFGWVCVRVCRHVWVGMCEGA